MADPGDVLERVTFRFRGSTRGLRYLNWLSGFALEEGVGQGRWDYPPSDTQRGVNDMQREVIARVDGLVSRRDPPGVLPKGAEALTELLAGRGVYAETPGASSVAPFPC